MPQEEGRRWFIRAGASRKDAVELGLGDVKEVMPEGMVYVGPLKRFMELTNPKKLKSMPERAGNSMKYVVRRGAGTNVGFTVYTMTPLPFEPQDRDTKPDNSEQASLRMLSNLAQPDSRLIGYMMEWKHPLPSKSKLSIIAEALSPVSDKPNTAEVKSWQRIYEGIARFDKESLRFMSQVFRVYKLLPAGLPEDVRRGLHSLNLGSMRKVLEVLENRADFLGALKERGTKEEILQESLVTDYLKRLESNNTMTRKNAMARLRRHYEELSQIAEPEKEPAMPIILKRLEHDPNCDVRRNAALTLGVLRSYTAIEPLAKLLQFGRTTEGLHDEERTLMDRTNENDKILLRRSAVIALGLIGSSHVIPALNTALDDPYAEVRMEAVKVHGRINDAKSISALVKRLGKDELGNFREPDKDVRGEIRKVLTRLLRKRDEEG